MFVKLYTVPSDTQFSIKKIEKTGDQYFFLGTGISGQSYIGVLDSSFTVVWIKKMVASGTSAALVDLAVYIPPSLQVSVFLYGHRNNGTGKIKYFVAKIDTNGTVAWARFIYSAESKEMGKRIMLHYDTGIKKCIALFYGSAQHTTTGYYPEIGAVTEDGVLLDFQSVANGAYNLQINDFGDTGFMNWPYTLIGTIWYQQWAFACAILPFKVSPVGGVLKLVFAPNLQVLRTMPVDSHQRLIHLNRINNYYLLIGWDYHKDKHFIDLLEVPLIEGPESSFGSAKFIQTNEESTEYDDLLKTFRVFTVEHPVLGKLAYLYFHDRLGNITQTRVCRLTLGGGGVFTGNFDWVKKLDLQYKVNGVIQVAPDKILSYGTAKEGSANFSGLFALSNLEFTTCKTQNQPQFATSSLPWNKLQIAVSAQAIQPVVENPVITWAVNDEAQAKQVCAPGFELKEPASLQSPYLHLQSAGSTGTESSPGIHLRWMLRRNLGDTHLPKGNSATNTANFNKPDDFVKVFRANYTAANQVFQTFNLDTEKPTFVNPDANDPFWMYTSLNGGQFIYLRFLNPGKYATAAASKNPSIVPYQILTAYGNEVLEIEFRNTLLFSVDFQVQAGGSYTLQTEVFSAEDNMPLPDKGVSARVEFTQSSASRRIVSENICALRCKLSAGTLRQIKYERYSDFLNRAIADDNLLPMGAFALTQNSPEAFKRLEETSRFTINGVWKKFNGTAFVKTTNYQNRWNAPGGTLAGVTQYINLTNANPANIRAEETPPVTVNDKRNFRKVSYLDMLQMASFDYHVARMLGLGHVDVPPGDNNTTYIYLAEYNTLGVLDDGQPAHPVQHLYLSLPTARKDERLPAAVDIKQLKYGLVAQENTPSPIQLTDNLGYTPDGTARYIRLFAGLTMPYDKSFAFFQPGAPKFQLSGFTSPLFVGFEYKKQGQANWKLTEIAHDEAFTDTSNVDKETLPAIFPADPAQAALVHKEIEAGIHEYAAYAINIFSRASGLSPAVATDTTQFIKRNTLLPPSDFRVQLIQPETTPFTLTTQYEQDLRAAIAGTDKTLVRVSFNYTHLHDANYNAGNRADLFFRPEMPRNVVGAILSVAPGAAANLVVARTKPYTYTSSNPVKTVMPTLPPALKDQFVGGVFIVNETRYIIDSIDYTGTTQDAPNFVLRKNENRPMVADGGGGQVITPGLSGPGADTVNQRFMAIENMAQAASWPASNPLSFSVNLGSGQWSAQNDVVNGKNVPLRGIWAKARCKPIKGKPGYFIVEFSSFSLQNHPQAVAGISPVNRVDWFKGVVRIPPKSGGTGERRAYDVISILTYPSGANAGAWENPLKLLIFDEGGVDLATNLPKSNQYFDLNTQFDVNFYPGYKAYLFVDTPKGLTAAATLPAVGTTSKNTLMGVRSADSTNGYTSPVGVPAILMAQEIVDPVKPAAPVGDKYATPPDWYNKSTYTFTNALMSEPYAMIYYRADINGLLRALYKPETIGQQILPALAALDPDPKFSERWADFVAIIDNTAVDYGTFPVGSGYKFPWPDNPANGFDGMKSPGQLKNDTATGGGKDIFLTAFYNAFIPLSKQPLLYKKEIEMNMKITPAQPAKKASTGSPLTIRFADFTIDGGMITAYFYFARTMGNRMALSERSAVLGPVRLVNTRPPEVPVLRKVTSQLADAVAGVSTAVLFDLNAFSPYENIRRVAIYRATNPAFALTVKTMKLARTVVLSAADTVDGITRVTDDFQDLTEIPYGDPLYYRLVALREIKYTDPAGTLVTDYVPSLPTKTLLANVVDTVNPEPPTLNYAVTNQTAVALNGVKIGWSKTTYNGKYTLFKMSSAGQWTKIYEITTLAASVTVDLANTTLGSNVLATVDEDGDPVFHRFKVNVEGRSGLLNLVDRVLTIGGS